MSIDEQKIDHIAFVDASVFFAKSEQSYKVSEIYLPSLQEKETGGR